MEDLLPQSISLSTIPSLLAASLVLLLGTVLCKRIGFLNKYSIPSPIVGGLVFAIAVLLLNSLSNFRITLETTAKPYLLLLFFASIGLTADLRLLLKGGMRLLWFMAALIPFLIAQNALGVALAEVLGLHPLMGLIGGTITLIGGHGTGAAYAQRFAEINNIQQVMELTMTAATLGLVLGGIVGGPVAEYLVKRHRLSSTANAKVEGGATTTAEAAPTITTTSYIGALAAAFAAVIAGQALGDLFEGGVITLPSFLWCLIIGLFIRNGGDAIGLRVNPAAAELIGSVSLSIFLAWTMMALDLVTVVQTAGALIIVLLFQAVLCAAWAIFICFRLVGRDYEAAVSSAAFIGFSMGATATAIANMQAVTQRHGPAPQSFIIVPIVGAFLIDLMNALVLTGFLSLPFMGGG
jgi:ESS family glutamate:Na+ symporter